MNPKVSGGFGEDPSNTDGGKGGGVIAVDPVATPVASTSAPLATPPNYNQFMQQFSARPSPVTYNGGPAPIGMNQQDAAALQAIYTPRSPAPSGFAPPARFAAGGMPMPALNNSWITRREATGATTHNGGLFASAVPGRTDKLNTLVPGGAYVVPADVVSGLGEGNTMAGASVLDKMFHSMPYGIQGPKLAHGSAMKAPTAFKAPKMPLATGGPTQAHVPIVAAGGEFLIHPSAVRRLGGGNLKKGQQLLDAFVNHVRKKTIHEMKHLKGPKK